MAARFGVFLGAFLATAAGFRAVAAPGGGALVGSKLQHFEAEADRYDTVFLGSSHVFRSFVPQEFDRILNASGVASSSFNFGVQMPSLLESHYLLRRILESQDGTLRRVFIEYLPLSPQIDPGQAFIPRVVHWHDAEETALAASRVLVLAARGVDVQPLDVPGERWSATAVTEKALVPGYVRVVQDHVEHFLYRLAAVGRSKDVARGALGMSFGQTASMASTAGYVSLEEEAERLERQGRGDVRDNAFLRRRTTFLEGLADYEDAVSRLGTDEVFFGDREWLNEELLRVHDAEPIRRMAEACAERDVQLILVVMPGLSCDRAAEAELIARDYLPVLRYNVPDEVPELYAVENRFDSGHPSAAGAEIFTRRLAEDFLRLSTP